MAYSVMLVEDDPDIRELATMALEFAGDFTVHGCESGDEALEHARRLKPDVILLDWMMPGLDGGQTLEVLRTDAGTARIPVIFLTAKIRDAELEEIRKLGVLDVITKPFDPMTLPDKVRAALLRRAG